MHSSQIPQDIQKGIYYYTLAAELNDASALNNIGMIYFELKAIKHLTYAANQEDNQEVLS